MIAKIIELREEIVNSLPVDYYKYLLQGLFAGDGSIELTKKKTIREINFTNCEEDIRHMMGKLLDVFNIKYKNDVNKKEIRIYGYDNFRKINQLDIFKFHPERNEKFRIGLENAKTLK
ncbi:MAG: LAGLIDADG family homing endonuclease [Nanoarchaeota archaeon]|nr:LAGLIDADG family homing endonuclease [Nanoarchaeota archaeon]